MALVAVAVTSVNIGAILKKLISWDKVIGDSIMTFSILLMNIGIILVMAQVLQKQKHARCGPHVLDQLSVLKSKSSLSGTFRDSELELNNLNSALLKDEDKDIEDREARNLGRVDVPYDDFKVLLKSYSEENPFNAALIECMTIVDPTNEERHSNQIIESNDSFTD